MTKRSLKRLFVWALALAAIAFVASAVPIRDRCVDPSTPTSKVITARHHDGCTLYRPSGPTEISRAACEELQCEPGLASVVGHARMAPLLLLFAVYMAGSLFWALRWCMLLKLANVPVSVRHVWLVTTKAQAAGVLLPGGVMGDAFRVGSIAADGADLTIVIASVLLDRAIGLMTVAVLAVTMALVFGAGQTHGATAFLAAIPLGFFAAVVILRTRFIQKAEWLRTGRIGKIAQPIVAYFGHQRAPRVIMMGVLASLVVSAVQFATIRGFVWALGATPTTEKWVYVGSAIAMIVGALPMLPGGWGTTDAAYILFLGQAGLSAGIALAVCLLYRLCWYVYAVLGALLYLGSHHSRRKMELGAGAHAAHPSSEQSANQRSP